MATLTAMYNREHRHNKFMAMLQGIDIDENKTEGGDSAPVTFEEVKARAAMKLTGNLELANAARYGFDRIDGTGYQIVGLENG